MSLADPVPRCLLRGTRNLGSSPSHTRLERGGGQRTCAARRSRTLGLGMGTLRPASCANPHSCCPLLIPQGSGTQLHPSSPACTGLVEKLPKAPTREDSSDVICFYPGDFGVVPQIPQKHRSHRPMGTWTVCIALPTPLPTITLTGLQR